MQVDVINPISAGENQPAVHQKGRRFRWLISLAIGAVLLVVIFLFLDLRIMKSNSSANSTTATYRSGDIDLNWKNTPVDTALYVEAPGNLRESLRKSLKPLISNKNYIGAVGDLNAPDDKLDTPQLYVQLIPVNSLWTPVYARSTYQVVVSYASNGDLSFRKTEPVRFEGKAGQPAVLFKATSNLVDTSWGVVSLRGYQSYIIEKIAKQIVENLVVKE